MNFVNRFNESISANVVCIGNTLGLSKLNGSKDIGAFISQDDSKQVPGYNLCTTLNWEENCSSAVLKLVTGQNVIYAELIWSGSVKSEIEDVSMYINNPIDFITPLKNKYTIKPDEATSQTYTDSYNQQFYVRSANVTDIVKESMSGKYSVARVAGTAGPCSKFNESNCCGWSLVVVYSVSDGYMRNINVSVGAVGISKNDESFQVGFKQYGKNKNSKVMMSVLNGSGMKHDGQIKIGYDSQSMNVISNELTRNNNFFIGQVTDKFGDIDTEGTFGNLNAIQGQNRPGVRSGYDIVNMDIDKYLIANQENTILNVSTVNNTYVITSLITEIGLGVSSFSIKLKSDKKEIILGDTVNSTIILDNDGDIDISNIKISANSNRFQVSNPYDVKDIVNVEEFFVDNLPAHSAKELKFVTKTNDDMTQGELMIYAMCTYDCIIGSAKTQSCSKESNMDSVILKNTTVNVLKSVKKSNVLVGDEIEYEILINNANDISMTNVHVKNSTFSEVEYLKDSLKINGINITGQSLADIYIPGIDALSDIKIEYKGIVKSEINGGLLNDFCTVEGYLQVNNVFTKRFDIRSNYTKVKIDKSGIDMKIELEKTEILKNEYIKLFATIKNTGTLKLKDIVLDGCFSKFIEIKDESVVINSGKKLEIDSNGDIYIPSIDTNETIKLSCQIKAVDTFLGSKIKLKTKACAKAMLDVYGNLAEVVTKEDNIDVSVYNLDISIDGDLNKKFIEKGEEFKYNIKINNNGNLDIQKAILYLSVNNDESISLISDNSNFFITQNKVNIGDLKKNQTIEIPIIVRTRKNIYTSQINIKAKLNALATLGEYVHEISSVADAKKIMIENIKLSMKLSSDKQFVLVGNTYTHSAVVSNDSSVDIQNATYRVEFPKGISIVKDSIKINGESIYYDVENNVFEIGELVRDSKLNLSYDVSVDEMPIQKPFQSRAYLNAKIIKDGTIKEIVVNDIFSPVNTEICKIDISRKCDLDAVQHNGIATFNVSIKNLGSIRINEMVIQDIFSERVQVQSKKIKDMNYQNIVSGGIYLPKLDSLETVNLSYSVKVPSDTVGKTLNSKTKLTAKVELDGTHYDILTESDDSILKIETVKLVVNRTQDKKVAVLGDVITHSVHIRNEGTIEYINAIFRNPLPRGFSFVPGSFVLNGISMKSADIVLGVRLGNIRPDEDYFITFKVFIEADFI